MILDDFGVTEDNWRDALDPNGFDGHPPAAWVAHCATKTCSTRRIPRRWNPIGTPAVERTVVNVSE
jgi:O-methyltransferase involved in polyketide biosynthesis